MNKIGIFFGSDTGNTEKVANLIHKKIGKDIADIFDISKCNDQDIKNYKKIIFGIPTWYYGDPQCDWEDFFPTLKKINFKNKKIAIFGCGDQEDYSEYFCDAMGILNSIIKNNGADIVGKWSTKNYKFEASKGLLNEKYFVGLVIDEDRQPELTIQRTEKWVKQIIVEMKINL